MPQVFISYVREDFERVQKLSHILELYRVKVWLDRHSLKPGYRWKKAIRDGIREGDFFVACFSNASSLRAKSYMNEELTLAIDELRQRSTDRAWFLPVLLDDVEIPDRDIGGSESLHSIQWVRLCDDWTQGITKMLAVISPSSAQLYELSEALQSTSARSRIKAADELGMLGELAIDAVPLLAKTLDDENETARAAAANALGKIGSRTEQVIAQLRKVASSRDYYAAKHATGALEALKEKGVGSLFQITSAAAAQDPTSINVLVDELRRGNLAVIKEIGRLGTHAIGAIPTLCDVDTRESTVALGNIGDPSAVPELIERMKGGGYWERIYAAEALEQIADTSSIEALIDAIQTDEDMLARAASNAILAIGTTEAIRAIIPVLQKQLSITSTDESDVHARNNAIHLCANAARVLGEIGERSFVPVLLPLLSETWTIFKEAATSLLNIGTPEAVAAVAAVAMGKIQSTDNFERMTSVQLLGRIGDPSYRPILMKMLEDPEYGVRTQAEKALRRISPSG